jgi:hypothetical protein
MLLLLFFLAVNDSGACPADCHETRGSGHLGLSGVQEEGGWWRICPDVRILLLGCAESCSLRLERSRFSCPHTAHSTKAMLICFIDLIQLAIIANTLQCSYVVRKCLAHVCMGSMLWLDAQAASHVNRLDSIQPGQALKSCDHDITAMRSAHTNPLLVWGSTMWILPTAVHWFPRRTPSLLAFPPRVDCL